MTESDIKNAMHIYKSKNAHKFTFKWIMNATGIEYQKTTRRREQPLSQKEHLMLARQRCDELHPEGSWRGYSDGATRKEIFDFIKEHPQASINECIKACSCSRASVYKYWEECRKEIGLDVKKRVTNAETIKLYRKSNPNAKKADCIRDLGLSKGTVYKFWDDK